MSRRGCASSGGRSRPARRRRAEAAPGRSKTEAWSCCRAILRFARRCSASSTWRPRVPAGAIWPPTSPLSSARWSGRSRRPVGFCAASCPPPGAPLPAARAGSRSGRSPESPCTGWPSGSSWARARPMPCRRSRSSGERGAATTVDLLGEATVTAAEADRYAQRCDEALRTLAKAAQQWPRPPALDGRPARQPARQGHGAHREGQGRGARARHRGRRPPARDAAAHGQAGRRAPARRHGVDGLARPDHAARHRAPQRAGVPRRAVGRHRPPGLPARRRRATRPAPGRHPSSRSRSGSSKARTGSTRRSRRARTAGPPRSTRRRWNPIAPSNASPSVCWRTDRT